MTPEELLRQPSLSVDMAKFFDSYDGYDGDVVGSDTYEGWIRRVVELESALALVCVGQTRH